MIKTIRAGGQERRYGDHVYEWVADDAKEFTEEKIKELVGNSLSEDEYYKQLRNRDNDFETTMNITINGRYKLIGNKLEKRVDYID